MRRMVLAVAGLGTLLALGGCSLALSRETRAQLHHAMANGADANPQLGNLSFKAQKDLYYSLTPLPWKSAP